MSTSAPQASAATEAGETETAETEAAATGTAATETSKTVTAAASRRPLRAWLSQGSYGPTDLTRRGVLLVVVSVLAVLVPVVTLTLLDVDSHVSLKVWILAVTVIALLGALLRVVADMRPGPRSDLDRAGKAVGAVAALFTALAVIIDWSLLHL
ncbi:hypothetical protein GSU69_17660 [Rathayibacter festucae]|uniref:DUF202 domain-containing protein n=1 Tax=Rathayibacter festucae TaxID=110937 RepID=A0ABX6H3U3_9MICO|nr:hypothetical protein [Rathayibacter festucae]QHC64323.1 hypothetical protein GSU69_17660 [Rathayibacter festucae]